MGPGSFVRVTALSYGPSNNSICTLVELGSVKLLFDAGKNESASVSSDETFASKLRAIGKIDMVILSHAERQYVSGLPYAVAVLDDGVVPVLCTVPTLKYGRLLLYDIALQECMENENEIEGIKKRDDFLDKVDGCFSEAFTVKYYQSIAMSDILHKRSEDFDVIKFCAYPSGRTIGGTIWKITYKTSEILYAMDFSIRKETVLDGGAFELLPESVPLLILDSTHYQQKHQSSKARVTKTRKEKEEHLSNTFIPSIIECVRNRGNVIIPVDCSSRILEVLYVLAKYWHDNQGVQQYPLVLLSHVGGHIKEYARSLLEWASDSLCRGFYIGEANPFSMHELKTFKSTRELDLAYGNVPKVVLVTDSTLSHGLSKELLLKWGGDPRTNVLFLDAPVVGSLAYEVCQMSNPPYIISVHRLQKVLLSKQELVIYEAEKKRLQLEKLERDQRTSRENELALLRFKRKRKTAGERDGDSGTDHASDSDDSDDNDADDETGLALSNGSPNGAHLQNTPSKSARMSNAISKFLTPKFPMFETKKDTSALFKSSVDSYGLDIDDIDFQIIAGSSLAAPGIRDTRKTGPTAPTPAMPAAAPVSIKPVTARAIQLNNDKNKVDSIPTKTVKSFVKVQLTCNLSKFYQYGGHADVKQYRAFLQKLAPKRVILLGGSVGIDSKENSRNSLMHFIQSQLSLSADSIYLPELGDEITIELSSVSTRLVIPNTLVPSHVVKISGSLSTNCQVCSIHGNVKEIVLSELAKQRNDDRLVRLLDKAVMESLDMQDSGAVINALKPEVGCVSVGEVMINSLKNNLEQAGIHVDYRAGHFATAATDADDIGSSGGVLVCNGQTVVRKVRDNEFIIEGGYCPTYFEVRKVLYSQYEFVY